MIFRLSQKLNNKIKAGRLAALPLDENPFADWSAHLFIVDRTQYIILTNTKSLYSTVMSGKGVTDGNQFVLRALSSIREFMEADGQEFLYHRFIMPATDSVRFAKALDRSITGSMNDLIKHATLWLAEGTTSPFDVGFRLNDILMSALAPSESFPYGKPREAFQALADSWAQQTKQPAQPVIASVEADLLGAILEFHKKVMTLLRQSSLDENKMKVVADRIKTLLDSATAEMKGTHQLNLKERMEAAYNEVKRLVDELSVATDDGEDG